MSGSSATLVILLAIAALITIHEFGHFLVAKACGVDVRVFSIGFGGRMFGFRWRGTDYRVSWFPFGGYVRMAGADPFMEGGADDEPLTPGTGSFMAKPPWQRLLIVAAGPVMNLLLPVAVLTTLMVAGEPQHEADIGAVRPGTPAAEAGLQPGDRVVSAYDTPVTTWIDVVDVLDEHTGQPLPLTVERAGARVPVTLPAITGRRANLASDYGIYVQAPDTTVVVDDPASPAGRAGLRTFDVITALDGRPVEDWNELSRAVVGAEGPLKVTYRRGPADTGAVAETTLEPDPAWAPKVLDADGDVWRRWGFAHSATTVATVSDDSAAKKAGVAVGDHLLAVDGAPIREWDDIVDGVAASASGEGAQMTTRPVELVVRRDGQLVSYAITPKIADPDAENGHRRTPRLGIGGEPKVVSPPLVPRPYPLTEAAPRALDETVTIAGEIVQGIGKILTNEVKLGDSLGGPVEIFRQGRAVARTGLWNVARWMAGISVSIGIINLLPIPVLDGGQFMIYLAEWVRGRPLPLAFRERALQLGVIFLVLLFLFVMVNDIHRAVVS